MQLRPEEISSVIKAQIKNYDTKIEQSETGTIILIGDGIARADGLEMLWQTSWYRLQTANTAWQ